MRILRSNKIKEDITRIKAVVKETQSLLRELENCGLIKIEGDTAEVTEKGRKFLEHLKEIEKPSPIPK